MYEQLSNSKNLYEAYIKGMISLGRLAELLGVPIEEAKANLEERNYPVNLGVESELDLLSDLANA